MGDYYGHFTQMELQYSLYVFIFGKIIHLIKEPPPKFTIINKVIIPNNIFLFAELSADIKYNIKVSTLKYELRTSDFNVQGTNSVVSLL